MGEFLQALESKIPTFRDYKILYKFPLVELNCTDLQQKLMAAGFGSSETIILEPRGQSQEVKRGVAPPPAPAPAPPPPSLFLQEIPDDNSCLFNAIGYVLEKQSLNRASELRQMIAEYILARPDLYSSAVLGKSPSEYARWILRSDTWGGAIELSIFSEIYGVEIGSFDVQTGRCDLFGEGRAYESRVYLQYTGIHYEAFGSRDSRGALTTIFSSLDSDTFIQIKELVEAARAAHRFTDVSSFTLRCGDCRLGMKGQKDAVTHAQITGHTDFMEYHDE